MKNTIILLGLLFISLSARSQVHWLINQDKVTDCKMILSAKFINKISGCEATPGYYILIKDGISTEYVQDGKYFVRSKLEFASPCKYKATIIEITIPDYSLKVGTVFHTEILETASVDNLIKIRSRLDEEWTTLVLEKVP